MSSPRLPVAAVLLAALAAHGDEAIRSDGSRVAGQLTLLESGRFRFRSADADEPIAGLDRVRFTPKVPAGPLIPLWHQVHLTHGQLILGEVRKLDDTALHVRPAWADTLVIPRTTIERVTHLPGWRPVLFDSLDSLAAWTKAGEPRAFGGQLVLDRGGQSVEAVIKPALMVGRVGLTFRSQVTTSRQLNLDLGFVRGGQPNLVRAELIGPAAEYSVVAADRADSTGKLKREVGRRRLTVEFDKDRLAIFLDELVLWVGDAGPGELRSIKIVGEGDGTESAAIDDVAVMTAEPIAEPRTWADLTADAVRSPDNDETFGSLSAIGPDGVTLQVKDKKVALGWPEVAEFTFRRGSVSENALRGEHVRVRLRTAQGIHDELDGAVKRFDERVLALVHPVLGEVSLPRDRIEEIRFLFHGRRVTVDSTPHHLGARPAFGFAVPKPEGLQFSKTINLDQPGKGFVVIDAARLSRTGTKVEVRLNGELVGELNRLAGRAQPVVRTYRLPVAALQRGNNEVEVRLRPAEGAKVTGIDVRAVRLELADPR